MSHEGVVEADGAVLDTRFPATAVDAPGVSTVVVTGFMGVGKSTVMSAVEELMRARDDLDVLIVKEGADEEPFASALEYRYTGKEVEGERLDITAAEFQNLVTHVRARNLRAAVTRAKAMYAETGKPVVVLIERCRQDAGEIFIPAGRRVELPHRRERYDLTMMAWYGTTLAHGEFIPDCVVMLSAPLDTALHRCDVIRDRVGERGYKDMLEPGTDKPYRTIVHEMYEAMGERRGWNTAIPGAQCVIDSNRPVLETADAVVDYIVKTVMPIIEAPTLL